MILDAHGRPVDVAPPSVAAFCAARDREFAALERSTAIDCLKWLHWDGTWTTPHYEPTEDEIAGFIAATRENPRVVPSFDPGDP